MMQKIVWLASAGALGTLARYGLAGFIHRLTAVSFPLGTIAVNLSGCFLAGLFWSLFEYRWPVPAEVRTAVMVGFLGAFTTFSTLILETAQMLEAAEWMHAVANLALQNGVGFAALFIGAALGRMI